MRLRSSLLLGTLLPFTLLGIGDCGRMVSARPQCEFDAGCFESVEAMDTNDFTDTGVGCTDDCLEPAP